jgi:hypothetical protein
MKKTNVRMNDFLRAAKSNIGEDINVAIEVFISAFGQELENRNLSNNNAKIKIGDKEFISNGYKLTSNNPLLFLKNDKDFGIEHINILASNQTSYTLLWMALSKLFREQEIILEVIYNKKVTKYWIDFKKCDSRGSLSDLVITSDEQDGVNVGNSVIVYTKMNTNTNTEKILDYVSKIKLSLTSIKTETTMFETNFNGDVFSSSIYQSSTKLFKYIKYNANVKARFYKIKANFNENKIFCFIENQFYAYISKTTQNLSSNIDFDDDYNCIIIAIDQYKFGQVTYNFVDAKDLQPFNYSALLCRQILEEVIFFSQYDKYQMGIHGRDDFDPKVLDINIDQPTKIEIEGSWTKLSHKLRDAAMYKLSNSKCNIATNISGLYLEFSRFLSLKNATIIYNVALFSYIRSVLQMSIYFIYFVDFLREAKTVDEKKALFKSYNMVPTAFRLYSTFTNESNINDSWLNKVAKFISDETKFKIYSDRNLYFDYKIGDEGIENIANKIIHNYKFVIKIHGNNLVRNTTTITTTMLLVLI